MTDSATPAPANEIHARVTSSLHSMNSDRPLSKAGRLAWLALNWLNNARGASNVDPSLARLPFRSESALAHWDKIDRAVSPARRLSDLFWYALPWERIATELGGSVRVVEVGCGTGRYGHLMQDCIGSAFERYIGLDVVPHDEWAAYANHPKLKMVHADSGETFNHLAGANLIITQSALEHFDEDVEFFRQVAQYVAAARHPVIQVHLLPSAGCLSTFMWHGVRQYTPRTISHVTRLFGADTLKRFYFLGSSRCNPIHRRYITYPWLLGRADPRKLRPDEYDRDVRNAVAADQTAPRVGEACFHALVLQSKVSQDVFAGSAQR